MSASNQNPNSDFGFASLADLVAHQYEPEPSLEQVSRRSSLQVAKEKVMGAIRRSAAISTRSLGLDR